ncbi:MAG: hypothetical protein LBH36_01210 [Candidatus Nomurabacteria bacterium]|jgi:hypothetical protein|nr:hypothetical protein [Candidatus Nomurabacteria bacterium]
MSESGIVIINGQKYDASTGLPVRSEQKNSTTANVNAVNSALIHTKTQHSNTLNRKYVAKSKAQVAKQKSAAEKARLEQFKRRYAAAEAQAQAMRARIASKKRGVRLQPLAQGDIVSVKNQPNQDEEQPQQHTLAAKANQVVQSRKPVMKRHLTAKEMKQRDISAAFERIAENEAEAKKVKKEVGRVFTRRRLAGVLSGTLAILLLVGYLAYLNMPAISVRIAAMQSGVDVSYPSYKPIGYDMNSLATVKDERVAMIFSGESGQYTITQQKSSWDSSAVLSNYVKREWGNNYEVSKERGLTIYKHDGKAAWVNGGVFFVVDGPKSISDQIEKIAISM